MKNKALLCIIAAISLNAAAETKLRVGDSFPNEHFIVQKLTRPWIERIKQLAGSELKLEYYPAEQIGKAKDLLSLTSTGVIDIGYVAPAFVGDKMPLSVVAELPLDFKSSCEGTPAFQRMAAPGGILDKQEFAPNGVRLLWTVVLPPYQLMTAPKVKFENLKSIEGLRVRVTGGAKELAVRKLGAAPVQIPSPEVYEAMMRGTVDGAIFPFTSVFSYGVEKIINASTVGENFGSFVVTYVINERKWRALSPELQKAITQASEEIQNVACKVADDEDNDNIRRLEEMGWRMVKFSDEDHQELRRRLDPVASEWAQTLDKRGKPGTQVLKEYQENLLKTKDLQR
ncbi:TRAP transporter substrate-binding protein [Tepidiphilus olei]|uniref:TRAP transporter substrate-binding protein n=1 Tax=Tepidiphilus olei TaxID=2502184 RepID=UPI00163D91C1|nr:TRAP transporter substrate-binding protein DctP [Tepidiphilus olei]